jgi:hypothetical protein
MFKMEQAFPEQVARSQEEISDFARSGSFERGAVGLKI